VVPAATQRQAVDLLATNIFSDAAYTFPPAFYNQLISTRWRHWGAQPVNREDYPVHEVVLMWQQRILEQLLSSQTLTRLADGELKVAGDQEVFTVGDLFARLTAAVFAEVDSLKDGTFESRSPAISSLRRNLQRVMLGHLGQLALGTAGRSAGGAVVMAGAGDLNAPPDARPLAKLTLRRLRDRIEAVLASADAAEPVLVLDDASRAHLEDLGGRIDAVLDVDLVTTQP
jgi:hypothetical protein